VKMKRAPGGNPGAETKIVRNLITHHLVLLRLRSTSRLRTSMHSSMAFVPELGPCKKLASSTGATHEWEEVEK
jgi:hypothetical protein